MSRAGAGSRRATGWLAMIGILSVSAACSGAVADRSSPPVGASTSPSASTAVQAATSTASSSSTPTPTLDTPHPDDGRQQAQVLGGGNYPRYSVEAPDDWSSDGHFVVKSAASVIGLSVWDVGQVPTDPCHWQGHMVDPGSGVEDLVAALGTQATRNASTPIVVTLAGHPGRYLEWSVPADMVVTGDADFQGCDAWPDNGHLDFVSWLGNGLGERYQLVPGQVDRLWVLDVDGQRLVVDATYSPDATQAEQDELAHVVESLQFEIP